MPTDGKKYVTKDENVWRKGGTFANAVLAPDDTYCSAHEDGCLSHGMGCSADEVGAHAEGSDTQATGPCSHSEGFETTAEGDYSHAEGDSCISSGICSHAEGQNCVAKGDYSHAEGFEVTTSNEYEHSCGKYNTSMKFNGYPGSSTLFSIGCGYYSGNTLFRRNAIEVNGDGQVFVKGVGFYNGFLSGSVNQFLPSSLANILKFMFKQDSCLYMNSSDSDIQDWANSSYRLTSNYTPTFMIYNIGATYIKLDKTFLHMADESYFVMCVKDFLSEWGPDGEGHFSSNIVEIIDLYVDVNDYTYCVYNADDICYTFGGEFIIVFKTKNSNDNDIFVNLRVSY